MPKAYDLTGLRFGKLVALCRTQNPKNKSKRIFWDCLCDCGEHSIVSTADLRSGKTAQCWKCAHVATGAAKRKDLVGKKFGKLTVTKIQYGVLSKTGKQRTKCDCICDCGRSIVVEADRLVDGRLCSCGCARKEIADKLSRDVVGLTFGRLTIIEELKDFTPRKVRCLCECGREITVSKTDVMFGHTKSCGCLQRERTSAANTKNLTGVRYANGVVALNRTKINSHGVWLWEFLCPYCGKTFEALPANVSEGKVGSCGCLTISRGEAFVALCLDDLGAKYDTEYVISDCKNINCLRFDFAVFNDEGLACLIEYDGRQHYEAVEWFGGQEGLLLTQERDQIKNDYCAAHHIPLYRIKYDKTEFEVKEIVTNIIRSVTTTGP